MCDNRCKQRPVRAVVHRSMKNDDFNYGLCVRERSRLPAQGSVKRTCTAAMAGSDVWGCRHTYPHPHPIPHNGVGPSGHQIEQMNVM